MQISRNIKIWGSLITILLVLYCSAWYLYDSRFKHELGHASEKSKDELSFVSILIQERMQNRNYQLAKSFIENWGKNSPEIVSISLVADNGFELARYNRAQNARHEYVEEADIQYSYDSSATLKLHRSLDGVYSGQQYFLYELLIAYILISSILSFLFFTNYRVQKQKQELITENKLRTQTEKLLKEREQNLSVTLNSIGDAVIATDTMGLVMRMNPVAEELTGWPLSEATGKPLKTIFPIVDAATRKPIENPVEKVIATGTTVFLSNHTTLISRNGAEYQIADSAAPIRDDGKTIGMILVFNDVTSQYQLRQSADKNRRVLQAIMDHSPAIIYVKDTEGQHIFVNHQFEKIFHTTRTDVAGKTASQLFSQDIAEKMEVNDKTILETGNTVELEETFVYDDAPHTYVTTKFPLLNEDGEIYALCGISTDITKHRQQEEQIRRSQKMDALGKLTGGIAHDYNNLLGIIQGYAEQLNEHLQHDVKLTKYAHDIQHAAERGAKLTKKLLSFAQLKVPNARTLDINQLLQDERLMLEKILTARIKLIYNTEKKLWPVNVDIGDLEDAIVNITINAMHAMSEMESGGQLTFRTSNEQLSTVDSQQLHLKEDDYVLISITDNGCGMNNVVRERIFDPFYTTKGNKGTGLGLSQVFGFIERSGGAIKVYSEPGHGTRFAMYFPRSRKTLHKIPSPDINTTGNLRGTETLLVVDDEHAIAELAYEILSEQGYRVLTANDGIEALALLKKESVDLIISDVIMPNMDGYELASQVQQLYPHIKIQMVSGFADDRHSRMTDNTLHQNILYKPYSSKTLLARIRHTLDKQDANVIEKNRMPANRNIMVMDDDENIRELFKLNLTKLGYKTLHAKNGEEAIALYQQALRNNEPIDVVIMDLSIPGGLGGKETAQKLLSLDPDARLIVASGYSEGPEMKNYQDYGFSGAIEKNFDREKIKNEIEKVLSSKKAPIQPSID